MSERRHFERFDTWFEVNIKTSEDEIPAISVNLSVDGMGIQAARALLPGTKCIVHFNLAEEVKMYGLIFWARFNPLEKPPNYGMGIQLEAISLRDRTVFRQQKNLEAFHQLIEEILEPAK